MSLFYLELIKTSHLHNATKKAASVRMLMQVSSQLMRLAEDVGICNVAKLQNLAAAAGCYLR